MWKTGKTRRLKRGGAGRRKTKRSAKGGSSWGEKEATYLDFGGEKNTRWKENFFPPQGKEETGK